MNNSVLRLSESILLVLAVVVSLAGCKGSRGSSHIGGSGQEVAMADATLLSVFRYQEFTEVNVRNAWNPAAAPEKYLLVPRDKDLPEGLPEGTVVRVPLQRVLVYSAVHTGLISELGCGDAIKGVCNASYLREDELKDKVRRGEVVDCGPDLAPDIEKIARLRPDAIILSPYENNERHAKVATLGIPVIECADYIEPSPLGRAEWVRLFGLLFDRPEQADSLFGSVKQRYLALRRAGRAASSRPSVLVDRIYGPTWDVPGKSSTMGQLIEDAGGSNPFAYLEGKGSLPLSPERVLEKASDADVWLVRYYADADMTLTELGKESPFYPKFSAFKKGKVWGCNTSVTDYFEQTPFHPDRQLEDLLAIIHPELADSAVRLRFFTPLKR